MSYTPPAGNAAHFNFAGAMPYTPPGGGTVDFDFDFVWQILAVSAAPAVLGRVAVLAQAAAAAVAVSPSPLAPGSVQALAIAGYVFLARAEANSPLGESAALADHALPARAAVSGPLAGASAWVWVVTHATGSVPGPLGEPSGLLTIPTLSRAFAPAVLGRPGALVYHDFSVGLGDVVTLFVMDLITPTGAVRIPISSWQATLQTGSSNYLQCVIPACAIWVSAINSATEFVISRRAVLPNGSALEYEMARAPATTPQFDRGPQRHTCTLSGYTEAFAAKENPPAIYDRALTGIRSISSGSSYRVRCAVDWLLRPGHRAFVEGAPFVVAYINYYAPSEFDCYMDVGS